MYIPSKPTLLALFYVMLFPALASAEGADAETRMRELEKQLQVLSQELAAMQQQMANTKEDKVKEKGKSQGTPVYAAFKDGIVLEDGTGNWKLAINGRVQADYRQFSPDEDAADTFSLRRARLGGTLTFYKDYVARVEGEYAGGSTTLTYGYVDINKFPVAKLRLGQFKPFYGLERSMSTNFVDFQERSLADALLGSTFDRGVMLFGSPTPGFTYSLAYVNGTGTADENNVKVDGKDYTARLTGNFAELMSWKDAVVHIGGFYADGNEASRRQAGFIPVGQTEGRGTQFFATTCASATCGGTAATANAFNEHVGRTRSGFETAIAYGAIKFQGEAINTSFDGDGFSRDIDAWYANLVWNVTGESFADIYKEGVFGRLRPKNNYKAGADGWGAFQVGLRYSQFDASDFKATNAAGTGILLNNAAGTSDGLLVATNEAESWTLGINWIFNPNVRVVTNLIRTNFDTPIVVRANGINKSLNNEEALTMRAQFDF